MDAKEYLEYVRNLKDNYSDEIPREMLHSSMIKNGKIIRPRYKVRKGWFMGFYGTVDLGIVCGFVDERIKRMMEDFHKYDEETDFKKRLTNSEDIKRANKILTAIIEELERKLSREKRRL
ncbi:hypothetical protein DRN73_02510 [Candidatus Pacearchaeota archaeon]|nr:MAG: hypothetical protein DRN73_02510 [Candidatus Pacearchaeota archaeon]